MTWLALLALLAACKGKHEEPAKQAAATYTVDSACAKKWEVETPSEKSPGYGEMTVRGESTTCAGDPNLSPAKDFVFNRVPYCAAKCREVAHAGDTDCKQCQTKGQGDF